MKHALWTLLGALAIASGCDNGGGQTAPSPFSQTQSSASSSAPTVAIPNEANTIALVGDDSAVLGDEIDALAEQVFFQNDEHGPISLVSSNLGVLSRHQANLTVKYFGLGEYSVVPIVSGQLGDVPQGMFAGQDATMLNVMPFGVSLTAYRDNQLYRYQKVCFGGDALMAFVCAGITFDRDNKTATFENIELTPVVSESNRASDYVVISGRFTWSEDHRLSIADSSTLQPPADGEPVAASEIINDYWDVSTDDDERYLNLQDYRFDWYDYQGDSVGSGDNCYRVNQGAIVPLFDDGHFQVIDETLVVSQLYLHREAELLYGLAVTATQAPEISADLQPLCDTQ